MQRTLHTGLTQKNTKDIRVPSIIQRNEILFEMGVF